MTKAVRRLIRIEADANGEPPKRIHLLSVGHWHTPWHGAFEHTAADLAEMVEHFDAGVGLVEGSKKFAINYSHNGGEKAAAWVTELSLDNDGNELWAENVEWTPAGAQALRDKEFRYISPEWNPRDFPWENPEVEGEFVENVITGAGLTNIPLFKKLTPIMASADAGGSDKRKRKGASMTLTLDEVRGKSKEELTADETAFLEEHKTELTDEERTKFEIVVEDAGDDTGANDDDKGDDDDADKGDNTKNGSAQVGGLSASEIKQLQADAKAGREASQKLLETDIRTTLTASITRGAVKSDQLEPGVKLLASMRPKDREEVLDFISNLPSNALIASELGDGGAARDKLASEELAERAAQIVKDTNGKTSYGSAVTGLMASDASLRERVDAERAGK